MMKLTALGDVALGHGDDRDEEPIEPIIEGATEEDVEPREVLEGAGSGAPEVVGDGMARCREHEAEGQQQEGLLGRFGKQVSEVALEERAEAGAIEFVHGDHSAVRVAVETHYLTKEESPCFVWGHLAARFSLN